ncbi:hypothetical protein AHMF7605_24055 [Adhaeribacter arboris]|uniref:Uncharacterized protein n=1 Tax=Adhaeribacter arboris TaxID=2072846 RepID=A0A2T2YLH4_9BACT|nr:hypothetical protein [Adhaeribacter arboris]PSR56350.1 hypothetical protein AHMF7605_24055 [Adhaeribacter arboris]
MLRLLTFIAFFFVLAFVGGCSEDDAPLADCPSTAYINGLIQQVDAINAEVSVLQTQLPNAQGADKDAITVKIKSANDRKDTILKELNNYRHCL